MIGTQYKTVKLSSFDIVCRQFVLYVACLIARVTAMHLHADVIEIVCGPSEALKTREEGDDLVSKIVSGTFFFCITTYYFWLLVPQVPVKRTISEKTPTTFTP